ncbi:tetratricopeptide repeat protein [Haloferula rosea]|uniref:Tetratricopeptide repeat protein n=1 Tax=Haloferula rosea TaxID=490093 RepID=A0A934RGM7_9BACT|nr:tetratricopeptide repeat protein [Haloferula rosea]MBK1828000.1 tetratricopeptide repeat protein [Haloferula rosea]
MKVLLVTMGVVGASFWSWWFTPDQQGDRLMAKERFAEAAEVYRDPMRRGVAWFKAGEFEKAGQAFTRVPTAEGLFNRGNSLVFLGLYEQAVAQYDRALEQRPDWESAQVNRRIAMVRAEALKNEGGDMGDQKIGADKIVFDKKKPGGQETQVEKGKAADDQSMQAMWLRKVDTDPAEFLRAKFSYQDAMGEEETP